MKITSLLILLFGALPTTANDEVTIRAVGGTLAKTLYKMLSYTYQVESDTVIKYESIGSGKAIDVIKNNKYGNDTISFAGSDAVLQTKDYVNATDLQMYPVAAAAVVPILNLKVSHGSNRTDSADVILSRKTLSGIFMGEITMWNDTRITSTNPGIHFPSKEIRVVVRADSSGTTEIFTKALNEFSGGLFDIGIGGSREPTTWSWFRTAAYTATYTEGMIGTVLDQDGSIGYASLTEAIQLGVDYASMINRAGTVVRASTESVKSALSDRGGLLLENPNLAVDIQDSSSASAWPIAGITYVIIRTTLQPNDSCAPRVAMLDFFQWVYTSSSAMIVQDTLGFVPLPTRLREGILDRMFNTVLCEDGRLVKPRLERNDQIEIPVPASIVSLFDALSAAFTGSDPQIEILTSPYEGDEQDKIWRDQRYSTKILTRQQGESDGYLVTPLFSAGIAVVYRLDGVANRIAISPSTLSLIYKGSIRMWSDSALALENPSVSFPTTPIRVVGRNFSAFTATTFYRQIDVDENNISPNVSILEHDSQVDASVSFEDGSIGFVSAIGDRRNEFLQYADTYVQSDQSKQRVSLNHSSISSCLNDYEDGLNCWPFILTFDLAVRLSDIKNLCTENDSSLDFAKWLLAPDTDIYQPFRSAGVVPISREQRQSIYSTLDPKCTSEDYELGVFSWLSAFLIGLIFIALVLLVHKQRRVRLLNISVRKIQNDLVALRTVVKSWSPIVSSKSHNTHHGKWYWEENEEMMYLHNSSIVEDRRWIPYSTEQSEELEQAYQGFQAGNRPSTMVLCILNKTYCVDIRTWKQENVKTQYSRRIRRKVVDNPTANLSEDYTLPLDIDCREPFLVLRPNSIIQVVKKRVDGWSYGTVILPSDAVDSKIATLPSATNASGATDMETGSDPGISSTTVVTGEGETVSISETTGWFPTACTSDPDQSSLTRIITYLGQPRYGSLDPPSHWSSFQDPLKADTIELSKDSSEYQDVNAKVLASIGTTKIIIHSIKRVQNLALYQGYLVKRQFVLLRQKKVYGTHQPSLDERQLFHGTTEDNVSKIIQQGFNRSFCGRNATSYGKGVYFSSKSYYSAQSNYSTPNKKKHRFMFLSRVIVGEYCLGYQQARAPDVRDKKTQELYDSTVDNMSTPSVFVTYHDHQAYPEYLICFTKTNDD